MKDLEVIRLFDSLRSNPEKYLRVSISPAGACIHLPDNQVHLSISHATLAEFVDNKRAFSYTYDASQPHDLEPDFKCHVAMKKNKDLAYILDSDGDLLSGYIHCKPKENSDEYEEDNSVASIFFGIVSTKVFTIIFAIDNQHSKTLQVEMLRADENQPSLEDIILTLNQLNKAANQEVPDGQEEKQGEE